MINVNSFLLFQRTVSGIQTFLVQNHLHTKEIFTENFYSISSAILEELGETWTVGLGLDICLNFPYLNQYYKEVILWLSKYKEYMVLLKYEYH